MREFHAVMYDLLAGMRQSRPAESSIAAHLMDIKDPHTGAPMPAHIPPACPALAQARGSVSRLDEEERAACAGKPLDDVHLLPEISILFMAGFESAHSPCPSLCLHHMLFISTMHAWGSFGSCVMACACTLHSILIGYLPSSAQPPATQQHGRCSH
jgi:hypothetical protein